MPSRWTTDQIVEQITRGAGYKGPTTIPYQFMEYAWDEVDPDKFEPFTEEQRQATKDIFAVLQDVANVTFEETITGETDRGNTLANFDLDNVAGGVGGNGRLWIDTAYTIDSPDEYGTNNYHVLLHEIGHFAGLEHPGNYDAEAGAASYADDALYERDTKQYTVMSYFDETEYPTGDFGNIWASTPMPHDILALQHLYGANTATRTGANTYGYNSAGTDMRDVFDLDLDVNERPVFTIYDRGGYDTLDLSGSSDDVVLDLNPMAFSSTHGMKGNIAIGPDTMIEKAIGGVGNDKLIGNVGFNVLFGGAGNDSLSGGGGRDWLYGQNGNDTLHGGDRLYGGANDDLLNGGSGADRLFGQIGNDILFKSSGTGWVDGGTGTDWLSMYYAPRSVTIDMEIGRATADVSTSFGFAGIEKVSGSKYSDVLRGASGNDTLYGWGGADIIEGRGGNDRLYGHDGVDRISGGDGNDSLFGGDGNDILQGDQGNDLIDGGDGVDRAVFTRAGSGVAVNLENTGAQYTGTSTGWDTIRNVEYLTGSNHDDFFRGNNLSNVLVGGRGSDRLIGEAGNDIMVGGTGNDVLEGRSGADVLRGGSGADKLFGSVGTDKFIFDLTHTGNLYDSEADIIHDFEANDTIHLSNTLTYGGSDSEPEAGEYTVWQHDGDFVISWKHEDERRDVIVRGVYGDNPTEWIETDVVMFS